MNDVIVIDGVERKKKKMALQSVVLQQLAVWFTAVGAAAGGTGSAAGYAGSASANSNTTANRRRHSVASHPHPASSQSNQITITTATTTTTTTTILSHQRTLSLPLAAAVVNQSQPSKRSVLRCMYFSFKPTSNLNYWGVDRFCQLFIYLYIEYILFKIRFIYMIGFLVVHQILVVDYWWRIFLIVRKNHSFQITNKFICLFSRLSNVCFSHRF